MTEPVGVPEQHYVIRPATRDEAEKLAALVREAFQTEAAVYGDIPPLHETAADIEATFDAGDVTLAADRAGITVGTVRGETRPDGTVIVRRLCSSRWKPPTRTPAASSCSRATSTAQPSVCTSPSATNASAPGRSRRALSS